MEPMPVVEPPLEPVKRKRDAFEAVSEEIKKCRITVSPGEIRLQKDIAELGQVPGVELSAGDRPSSVLVRFDDHRSSVCPSLFVVAVGKFYPHQAPRVHCLEQGYASPLVNQDGLVVHPLFHRDWMPMYTLGNMLEVLQQLRMMYTGEVEEWNDNHPSTEVESTASRSPHHPGRRSPRHHVIEPENDEPEGECQMEMPRTSSFTSTSSPF